MGLNEIQGSILKFAEVIVLDVLEKRGYVSASMTRTSSLCRWYTVRKGEDLYEVEAYDSQAAESDALKEYLLSLGSLPENNKFIRKPVEIISDRKVTCLIRPSFSGEPLHNYFIRPGKLTNEQASETVKSFESIHKYLQVNKLDNFAPLSIMFFITDDGRVLIDALKCGPWVKNYEHLTVISNYLNPELSWPRQVNYFRNSFALKLFLGDPGAEHYEEESSAAVKAFVDGIIKDKVGYQENLSALEKKYAPKSRGFFLRVALIVAVFILPLLAYFVRVVQSESSWTGLAYTDKPVNEKKAEERDEFAFEPDAESKVEVSHQFLQKSLNIKAMMLAGNFKEALDVINELSSINLRKGELEILNEIRTSYPKMRKSDFENAISLSRTFVTSERYDEAISVLEDIVERYQKGKDAEKAFALIAKIKELEISQKLRDREDSEKRAASITKDRLMVEKMDELQKQKFFKPVKTLDALNRRLDLIRLECVSQAAKYLLSSTMKMNSAEKRLYEQLLQFSNEVEKQQKLKLLVANNTGLGGLDVYDLSEFGVEYRNTAGGGSIKFAEMQPSSMYKVFKQTSRIDVERAPYYLYLYCLKYGLQKEAQVEFKLIKNKELLREADSLRDMKQARSDLFAKNN